MDYIMILKLVLIILAIIIIIILAIYNSLVKLRNRVREKESDIDIFLNQRFELIPNLVEIVKGYSKHEKDVLNDITEMRTRYYNDSMDLHKAENLNNKLNSFLSIVENYPDLKANTQFSELNKKMSNIEDKLINARTAYNDSVTKYNTSIETIPSGFIASLFNFSKADLFQIEEEKKNNINMKF